MTLREAVEALTKPRIEHFTQRDMGGKLMKVHTTEHPPLLQQLADAVNPSSNTTAGSASMASTRSIINSDALYEFAKMASTIASWCWMLKVRPTRYAVADLVTWHGAYRPDSNEDWHERELRKWAHRIKALLDPPKRFEVMVACPVCKNDHWTTPDDESMPWPILVEYTLATDGGSPVNPRAACRAEGCGAVWDSEEAIVELGEELAEHDHEVSPQELQQIV